MHRGGRARRQYSLWLGFSLLLLGLGCSGEPAAAPESTIPATASKPAAPESTIPATDSKPAAPGSTVPAPLSRRSAPESSAAADSRPVVIFLGDSLSAGAGLPAEEAFPSLIGEKIAAAGLAYRVVNAGVSGDTSAGGLARIDWLLQLPVAVLVLELGANDMLRGLGTSELYANLQAILDRTRAAHPEVRFVVAGMRAAPNLGPEFVRSFDGVYPRLAREYGAVLLPFLLEDVVGDAALNQADGIHPTAEGHRIIAEHLWQVLEPLLLASG